MPKPLYPYSLKIAKTENELEAYDESRNENIACKNGIDSVITCAAVAGVEDQTVEGFESVKHP